MILDEYKINKNTLALTPARAIDYDTIVIENDQLYYVRQVPYAIINNSCIDYGSTYTGRRDAVSSKTKFIQKVPIPIDTCSKMYAFPTHAVKHSECHWIFTEHIQQITDDPLRRRSLIHFKNNVVLQVNVSTYTLEKQFHCTLNCMMYFTIKP